MPDDFPENDPVIDALFQSASKPGSAFARASQAEYDANPNRLHGDKPPQVYLKKEQPWHRLLLYFKARGMSNKEAARRLDMTEVMVGQVARQPWFRTKLVALMREEGLPGVQETIRAAAPLAIAKLTDLMENAKREEVQRDCAMDILDRYLGKAPQVSAPEADPLAKVDEKRLDAEIEELQKKVGKN